MIGEVYDNSPVSLYQPLPDVAAFSGFVKRDYAQGNDILTRPWVELNNRSVVDDQDRGKRTFNAFVDEDIEDPATAWQWRGTRSKARNQAIAMHAQLTAGYIIPMFLAQNDDDEEDADFSEMMRDSVEWMVNNSQYKESFLQAAMGMLVNPVTYMGAEYVEVFQKIKERAADGIITDITIDVVNNDNSSAGSFDVSMYLYDQATTNYWVIGTTNVPSLSGNSLITISNWDIDINDTPGIPGGTYRLGVWVDSNEDITEGDENDNTGLLAGNIVYSATAIGDHAIDAASVTVFPNPSSIGTTLNYTLTEESSISIDIFDALGNKVESVQSQTGFGPGSYTHSINTENYANGIYFVTITSGVAQVTRRISVVH